MSRTGALFWVAMIHEMSKSVIMGNPMNVISQLNAVAKRTNTNLEHLNKDL